VHIPVLQREIIEYLDIKPNENFIDCTFGQGGHSLTILEKNKPNGKVLGIETDPALHKELKIKNRKRLILVQDSYTNLKEIVKKSRFRPVKGILFDLGISSWHLSESKRGFTFLKNETLDMRYNLENPLTASKIINFWSKEEIERILKEYGEERYAKVVAENIIEKRSVKPIETTFQLIEIIKDIVPKRYLRDRIHFATRTFQALRIATNDELHNLENTLPQALDILQKRGRLVVISFHSLEDRIVKNFFKNLAKSFYVKTMEDKPKDAKEGLPKIKLLTKKPIVPTQKEIKMNPRSRSAKLRVIEKIIN
jgi:16S rRNA (cytosine1402-N4)-methyltransferase